MKTTATITIGAGSVVLGNGQDDDLTALRIIAACASPVRADARRWAALAGIDIDLSALPAPMTWAEAWEIKTDTTRAAAMSACRCDMDLMGKLKGERIHTDGIERPGLTWLPDGRPGKPKPYTAIYELWRCNLQTLVRDGGPAYVVRCWCTTTGGEAWIWCGAPTKGDPRPALSAIASTFQAPEAAISDPHTRLMRQGDLLIVTNPDPAKLKGDPRPLTAQEYERLLFAES